MSLQPITIVGAGLAGAEAAWQAASRGVPVRLCEMRPLRSTAVHRTDQFAELVCSNSLRGSALEQAPGLLKEELRRSGSLVIKAADQSAVPAGSALAVSRADFARGVTEALSAHPLVQIVRAEVDELPAEGTAIIASGPLTSPALAAAIRRFTGHGYLAFYDAAAPVVSTDSLDLTQMFRASRYGKGAGDEYLNSALDREQYRQLCDQLLSAEKAVPHHPDDSKAIYFEGCVPLEELARRGPDTLRYGPLKPVGLTDPRTGRRPYAVVQLRQDNAAATLYNLVGFQTGLKWGEQERIFRQLPGFAAAEFERLGVIHRNTFINSPRVLLPTLQTRARPNLFFAGQLTGVEGYIESAAGGLVAGINAARVARGQSPVIWPRETAIGALAHYITHADPNHFQPMNIAFGLLPPLEHSPRDRRARKELLAERALIALNGMNGV